MNPGTSFDQRSLDALCVDEPAIAHAVAQLEARSEDRSLREGRLLAAVRCLDLTSLTGRETEADVRSLCDSARRPLAGWKDLHAAAVCVFPSLAPVAARALSGTPVTVAAAAGGFPAGLTPIGRRVDDVRSAVDAGAGEIDLVIDRGLAVAGRWEDLYGELRALRAACGAALMKVILAAGDLGSLQRVARAGRVAMMAGADFVKTSTGRERVNATLPVGVVLARTARSYEEETGISIGLKAAGGIGTAREARQWITLSESELGAGGAAPARFRLGASSLLPELERELESGVREEDGASA